MIPSSRFVSALSWWNLAVALLARLLAEAKLASIVGGQSDKTPLIKSTTVNSRSRCCMTHWFIINDSSNQMWLFICLYWILMDFSIILVWKLVETETDALTINKTKLVKWIKSPIKKVLSVRLVQSFSSFQPATNYFRFFTKVLPTFEQTQNSLR